MKAQAAATEKHWIASLNEAVCNEEKLGESLQTDGNKSDAKKSANEKKNQYETLRKDGYSPMR